MFGEKMLRLLASLKEKAQRQQSVLSITLDQIDALEQSIKIQQERDLASQAQATPPRGKEK